MNTPLRILHVLPWLRSGGVERRRLQLAQRLGAGFVQQVVCLSGGGPLVDDLRAAGTPVICLGSRPTWSPTLLADVATVVRAFEPDVVHGAVFEGCTLAVLGGKLGGAPHILVEETSFAVDRSSRGHALFRWLAGKADRCVAISPAVAGALVTLTKVPAAHIVTVTNGVELPVVTEARAVVRERFGIPHGALVVGAVGRLGDESNKRFADLIEAFQRARRNRSNIHLLIVGEGQDRKTLETLARQHSSGSAIHFSGYRYDTGSMYSAMDIFALASAREGFGLVVAEAMRMGLPVVATAVGGIPGIVVDGETGFLVPPLRPAALAEKLEILMNDAALRRRFGEAGRQRADAHFSAERYVADVATLYHAVVGR